MTNSTRILPLTMEPRSVSLSTITDDSSTETKQTTAKNFVCKYSLFFLRPVGLWAADGQEPSKFYMLFGYFGALVTVGIFAFQFTLLTEYTNGEIIAKFMTEFLSAQTTICKVLPIILNRKNILKIWQKTYQMRAIPKKSAKEKEMADGWDSFQRKLIKLFVGFYIAAASSYQIIPWLNGGKLPLKGAFPEWAKSDPWFYPVYIVTTMASMVRNLTITACDLCSIIVMCRLFSELQFVQHLISELEKNHHRKDLRRAIMMHAVVLDYGRTICDNYSMVFILQHFNIAMSISLLGAVAIYTSDFNLILNLSLLMAIYVSQLAVFCFAGEKLTQECLKITSCIENSYDKFLNDVPSLKLMTMMLVRAQEPLKFSFGSTRLSLAYYSQTLNTIYSFFMILKSMVK